MPPFATMSISTVSLKRGESVNLRSLTTTNSNGTIGIYRLLQYPALASKSGDILTAISSRNAEPDNYVRVEVNQAPGSVYADGYALGKIYILTENNTLTFTGKTSGNISIGESINLTLTSNNLVQNVVLSTSSAGIARLTNNNNSVQPTISNYTVTGVSAGNVTITALQSSGDSGYSTGNATASFTVVDITPTITFSDTTFTKGTSITLSASSNGGGSFTYSIIAGNAATLSGSTLNGVNVGTVTIRATVSPNGNYGTNSVDRNFTVVDIKPTITGISPATGTDNITVTISGTNLNNVISLKVNNVTTAFTPGTTISFVMPYGRDTVTILVTDANANTAQTSYQYVYLPAPITNYKVNTNDLNTIFQSYTSGTKTTTGYKTSDLKDLCEILQPYKGPTKAASTGYNVNVNGTIKDLNEFFEKA